MQMGLTASCTCLSMICGLFVIAFFINKRMQEPPPNPWIEFEKEHGANASIYGYSLTTTTTAMPPPRKPATTSTEPLRRLQGRDFLWSTTTTTTFWPQEDDLGEEDFHAESWPAAVSDSIQLPPVVPTPPLYRYTVYAGSPCSSSPEAAVLSHDELEHHGRSSSSGSSGSINGWKGKSASTQTTWDGCRTDCDSLLDDCMAFQLMCRYSAGCRCTLHREADASNAMTDSVFSTSGDDDFQQSNDVENHRAAAGVACFVKVAGKAALQEPPPTWAQPWLPDITLLQRLRLWFSDVL